MSSPAPVEEPSTQDDAGIGPAARPPTPMLQQIVDLLLWRISTGVYPPGCKLPTGLDLVQELGLSEATVTRARRELRNRGIVRTVERDGTYVMNPLPESFTAPETEPQLQRAGRRPVAPPKQAHGSSGSLIEWATAVLRSRIASGHYKPGDRLPVTRELEADLDVGKRTIDTARALLIQDGLLTANTLNGTFVVDELPDDLGPTEAPPRPSVGQSRRGPQSSFSDAETKQFGVMLQAAREEAGLTKSELGEQLGLSRTTIGEIESGYVAHPAPATFAKVLTWLTNQTPAASDGTPPTLAMRLKAARKRTGWTQKGLAKHLRIDNSAVSRIEAGGTCRVPANAQALEDWVRSTEEAMQPAPVQSPAEQAGQPAVAVADLRAALRPQGATRLAVFYRYLDRVTTVMTPLDADPDADPGQEIPAGAFVVELPVERSANTVVTLDIPAEGMGLDLVRAIEASLAQQFGHDVAELSVTDWKVL